MCLSHMVLTPVIIPERPKMLLIFCRKVAILAPIVLDGFLVFFDENAVFCRLPNTVGGSSIVYSWA